MSDPILRRIARETGVPELVELLAERLPATDLRSLLVAVFRRRTGAMSPDAVLRQHRADRFVRPAKADARALADVERLALDAMPPGWEALELSPLAPLGTAAALGRLSPDWAVATIRGTEVVSDTTNVLALECALRRERARGGPPTTVAAIPRVVRPQASRDPAALAHFRLLAVCTAGRDEGSFAFESRVLSEHVAFHLSLLERLGAGPVDVRLTDLDGTRAGILEAAVAEPLAARFPQASFVLDPTRRTTYYTAVCFAIDAEGRNLVDGGCTDWTQRLLSDRKERLLISGAGLERLVDAGG